MPSRGPSLYHLWLVENFPPLQLAEGRASPPEQFLQIAWQHQRIHRDRLATLDGARVSILHPGFRNRESGPDFKGAVVRFADNPPVTGDVEVDRTPAGWNAHGHGKNPAFSRVILQVVWEANTPPQRGLPVLSLHDQLDAPLEELLEWSRSAGPILPEELRGQCCAPLRTISTSALRRLMEEAALERLQRKGREFDIRARAAGWEQSLREGLFRALGYKKNAWPMQVVAELLPNFLLPPASPLIWQARLLGVAGLLPEELAGHTEAARRYLRQVWDHWWRERDIFSGTQLTRAIWTFHGQRPVNHPQRRLALAAHWMAQPNLHERLSEWIQAADPAGPRTRLAGSLLSLLQAESDPFWSRHWTLRSAPLARPQPLLGADRVTDLAMNSILPWLWSRAWHERKPSLADKVCAVYTAWPKGEDNSVLKLARQRLLARPSDKEFTTAASQQGLLQIVGDFCAQADALCTACRFPELAQLASQRAD